MVDARYVCVPIFLLFLAFLPVETAAAASVSAAAAATPESPSPTTSDAEQKSPDQKSPSIIQMLEGRESDVIVWASIAVAAFLVGWFSGGNYYLRRDRARSRKLRF
jgi:hypothetical protein